MGMAHNFIQMEKGSFIIPIPLWLWPKVNTTNICVNKTSFWPPTSKLQLFLRGSSFVIIYIGISFSREPVPAAPHGVFYVVYRRPLSHYLGYYPHHWTILSFLFRELDWKFAHFKFNSIYWSVQLAYSYSGFSTSINPHWVERSRSSKIQ